MKRSELIATIAERFPPLQHEDADQSVMVILDALARTLASGGRVEIRGFGSFRLNHRPPRIGRNPRTGEKVAVLAKWSPHFKAGLELRQLVNSRCETVIGGSSSPFLGIRLLQGDGQEFSA